MTRPTRRWTCALVLAASTLLLPLTASAAAAPSAPQRAVGGQALDDVIGAANRYARADCFLTPPFLAAMMLAPSWPETGAPSASAPSPMTLSRWDVNAGLFPFGDPNSPYRRAYFNPGVGMWQFDSAGLGRPHDASYYMNTATAAPVLAQYMTGRWCAAYQNANLTNDAMRRAEVWRAWHACDSGICETIFAELFDYSTGQLRNLTRFESVTRTGGMQPRRCRAAATGAVVDCWFVNPALAEGYGAGGVAWANPNSGAAAPLSLPFYVYEFGGREYRHWLAADTGFGGDINASRALTANARNGGLSWSSGPAICDLTTNRGSCLYEPPVGPVVPVGPTSPAIVGQGSGVGAVGGLGGAVIADRRSDGQVRISSLQPPFWSGWTYLGGRATSDPDVASVGNGSFLVAARGGDDAIWVNTSTPGGPTGWTSLGGVATSGPSVVAREPGRVEVFARGGDGALWVATIVNGGLVGWASLGGYLLSDPEVASWAADRLDVFAVGGDRQLWSRSFVQGAWQGWVPLGGVLASSPGAVSPSPGVIDVAARGTNGETYAMRLAGGGWSGWQSLGGSATSAPELAANGNAVFLFARGSNGGLFRNGRTSTSGWSGWFSVP